MTWALARAGVQVDVATTDDDGARHLNVPLGKPVVREGVTYWFFRRQTRFYKFSLPLTHWLAQHVRGYDLIHIHALFSYAAIPAALFAAREGVPYVVRPLGTLNRWGMQHHHPRTKRLSFSLIERRILAHAQLIHYTSAQERREAETVGINQASVVIPLGIDPIIDTSRPRSDWLECNAPAFVGKTNFLFLSRLDPKKGLELLLRAFAQLRSRCSRVGLVIAGEGAAAYAQSLRRLAAELGIQNDILWAGHVEGQNKYALLRCADVFVLPSYSENFGIAVVEALATGLPVIVTDQVGIHSEIQSDRAGLVIGADAGELTQALIRLVQDPALRSALGVNALRLAREKYSTIAMTRSLLNLYNLVLSGRRTALRAA